MRRLSLLLVIALAACSKKGSKASDDKQDPPRDAAVAAAAADAAPKAAPDAAPPPVPPGLNADGSGPPLPEPATGPRIVEKRRFRHSSVRGDFRIYVTASGLVTSWHTALSARALDGTPLWKRENLGRAVAVSADGKRIVVNNDAGDLEVLDAATGTAVAPATRLGGRDDPDSSGIYVSAFAWTPDGQHILAVDSKKVFLLRPDGTVERELPVCPDGNCFFASAIALSDEEFLLVEANDSARGLQRRKLADGAIVATGTYQGADAVLSRDGKRVLVDGQGLAMFDAVTLAPLWQASMPGARGVAVDPAASYASVQFKSMAKLSPDGAFVAVNDQSGRLWLLAAGDGKPLVAYPEDLIQFVEDVTWLDDSTLLVIDNDGHVARLAGTPPRLVWSQDDAPEPERWDEP